MNAISQAVRVTGRVQGVGFRVWVRSEAEDMGLAGWVRNEPDGTVAALLTGPEAAVNGMLDRLRQGPPAALVREVEARSVEPDGAARGFRIIA